MSVLLGLDVGTSGTRAVAVDTASVEVVVEASAGYSLSSPRPGWTEQDPTDWWHASKEVLGKVVAEVDGEVVGLSLTGQMHGSVFLDSSDAVIRPALLWDEQRTERQCEKFTEAVGPERLLSIAGNPALTGFQAPKILWLRPAYGAALLSGVACGAYRDVGEACAQTELREEVTLPQSESVASYNRYYEVYRSLYAANKDVMHRLSQVSAGE